MPIKQVQHSILLQTLAQNSTLEAIDSAPKSSETDSISRARPWQVLGMANQPWNL